MIMDNKYNDNHHDQSNEIGNGGVVNFRHDGAVLILQSQNNP